MQTLMRPTFAQRPVWSWRRQLSRMTTRPKRKRRSTPRQASNARDASRRGSRWFAEAREKDHAGTIEDPVTGSLPSCPSFAPPSRRSQLKRRQQRRRLNSWRRWWLRSCPRWKLPIARRRPPASMRRASSKRGSSRKLIALRMPSNSARPRSQLHPAKDAAAIAARCGQKPLKPLKPEMALVDIMQFLVANDPSSAGFPKSEGPALVSGMEAAYSGHGSID